MADNDGDLTPAPNDFSTWPAGAQEYLRELRSENGKRRVENKALNEKITKLSNADGEIRGLKLSNALLRHGVNDVDAVEFYMRRENKWDDLSPDDLDTLHDRVDDLIARRPELKGKPAPPSRSGISSRPGPGAVSTQLSRADLQRMRPEQVEDALKRGDLNQLLGRR